MCTACKRLSLDCSYPKEHHANTNKTSQKLSFKAAIRAELDDVKPWSEHPQMTHHALLKPGCTDATPQSGNPDRLVQQMSDLDVIADLHFPLHFSRIERQHRPAGIRSDMTPLNVDHLPLDHISVGGGGKDFLTPLLQPVNGLMPEGHAAPGNVTHNSTLANAPSAHEFDSFEFGPSDNLTVGDELIEPFAAAESANAYGAMLANRPQAPIPSSVHALSKSPGAQSESSDTGSNSMGPSTEKLKVVYPDLTKDAIKLFEYFRDEQSILMSVSPLNYFRSVFLAFSLRYRAILYGILAWAAWHQGDKEEVARHLFEQASVLVRGETLNSRSKEEILAALLILASAKICSGDTSDWRPYLVMAGETIHLHGGLTSFMESESVRWLLKNFAYHEILTSSSLNMPKLFSANDFEIIFNQPSSASLPDTLCACCQPLFVVLERINELTRRVRLLLPPDVDSGAHKLRSSSSSQNQGPTGEEVETIYIMAHNLEDKIWALQPAHKILQHLSDHDVRLQLALFDSFRLVAIIHMYQSVLRINSASLSMRVASNRLHRTMDELFGTMVEGILTFPLFILGISATNPNTRKYVKDRFDAMVNRLSARNVTQAFSLVEKVWALDSFGRNHVDWNELVDLEGLHFCFA